MAQSEKMKCVITCMCGGDHLAQCTCRRKIGPTLLEKGFVCKKIRVLPRCCQYFPEYAVKIIANRVLKREGGKEEIVEFKIRVNRNEM